MTYEQAIDYAANALDILNGETLGLEEWEISEAIARLRQIQSMMAVLGR